LFFDQSAGMSRDWDDLLEGLDILVQTFCRAGAGDPNFRDEVLPRLKVAGYR
jgi:hypothetical protein